MSLAGRLYDLARANLGALLRRDKDVPGGDLEEFSDDELSSELELRKQRRRRQDEARGSREAAERAARERAQRAGATANTAGAKADGASASKNNAGAPNNNAAAQRNGASAQAGAAGARANTSGASAAGAKAHGASAQSAGSARSTSSAPRPADAAAVAERKRIAALYAELESPEGADLELLKKNFRRLMRKYHPDFNGTTPDKLRAATDRTTRITTAYAELERRLAKK